MNGSKRRKEILVLIQANPGCTRARLAELLNITITNVEYHLHRLQRSGDVTARRYGSHFAYYVNGAGPRGPKAEAVEYVRQNPHAQVAIAALQTAGPCSVVAFAKALRVSTVTGSATAHRLEKAGVVTLERNGRCVIITPRVEVQAPTKPA